MKKELIALSVVVAMSLLFFSYSAARALFSDTATSSGNTFTAASEFPTQTPTPTGGEEVIPPTNTPTPTGTESTPTPTPPNIATHIVISEVQISTASAGSDFIELYNPTSSPINLNGMRLVKRINGSAVDTDIKSFGATDIIPANGFYLWASSDSGYGTQIGADSTTSQNITINNSIALRNGAINVGAIIDAVAWGNPTGTPLIEGASYATNPGSNESIERKAYSSSSTASMLAGDATKGNGYDTNDNSSDFVGKTVSQPQNSGSATETP